MEFIGRYKHRIDKKGRVSVPSAFRKILSEEYDNKVIITNNQNRLDVYPYQVFEQRKEKIKSLPPTHDVVEDYKDLYFGDAFLYEIDNLGRLFIPVYLREEVHLVEEVILSGGDDIFSIWDSAVFEQEHQRIKNNFSNIKKGIAQYGV
jgi:transcriptional regulator MraZ